MNPGSIQRASPPLVSVVLPVHNGERTIGRALDSVLAQTYRPLEIIVVDDGSSDSTARIVDNYRTRGVELIRSPRRQGAATARNIGIRSACGEFIAFQDADDEWLPVKTERQISVISSAPSMTLVCCWAEHVSSAGATVGLVNQGRPPPVGPDAWKALLSYAFVATCCAIVRKEAVKAAGLFDPTYPVAEDQDLWIRLARRGDVGFVDETLARVHETPNSLAKRYGTQSADYVLAMVRRHLELAGDELSAEERHRVLMRRFASLARIAFDTGAPVRGLALLLRATALGYSPLHDLGLLFKSLPPNSPLRRLYRRRAGWRRVKGHPGGTV